MVGRPRPTATVITKRVGAVSWLVSWTRTECPVLPVRSADSALKAG
jgi:hypothetical protein